MDRKRPRVDDRDNNSRRPVSPQLHERPPSKQPRRDDRGLPASLRGRVFMPNQQPREGPSSVSRPIQQQQQQHRDSRPAGERQQQHGSSSGRGIGSQPGRDREPGKASHSIRDATDREGKPGHTLPRSKQDGRDRSSSTPRAATAAAAAAGAAREPDINRQRSSQYDMGRQPAARPSQYDMSSSSHHRAGGRPGGGQQQQHQQEQRRPLARGAPLAQHSSRPAGHVSDSRHKPQQQQQQQLGGRQQQDSRPAAGGRERPGQPTGQHRGSSSSMQHGAKRETPASRNSSRGEERPAGQAGTLRREQRSVEPDRSSRAERQAPHTHTPAATATGGEVAGGGELAAVQPQPSPELNGQQQQQHSGEHAGQQQAAALEAHRVLEEQQVQSPGESQQHVQAAAAPDKNTGSADVDTAAAAAPPAGSGGNGVKRRPIEFNLASQPAPPVEGLKPRPSSKYSTPQQAQEQQAPAQQQQQQQQQARQAAGRSSGDRATAGSDSFRRDAGPQAAHSRRSSEAAGHSNDRRGSGAADHHSEHRQQQQQQRRDADVGHRRSSSGAAASSGHHRSRSRSRSPRGNLRSASRDRHATPAHSDREQQQQQQQQQPGSSVRGSQLASSDHEARAATPSLSQHAPSHDHGTSTDAQEQQPGSAAEALHRQQQQQGGKQWQQAPAAGSSRRHISPVSPPDAAAAAAAAAAASGVARMRSFSPVAAAVDAPHGLGLAVLRRPTQQVTLPLQPPSPLSAPRNVAAAAAAASGRPPEVVQALASLHARRQGMVALQLRGLPLSRHMAYKETWAAACKAGRLRPEAVDGALAAARRRAAAAQALRPRFGACLLPPMDPSVPVAGGGEEGHIQQLQRLIDAMAAQEAGPYCEQLPDGGSMLLPASLQGLLW